MLEQKQIKLDNVAFQESMLANIARYHKQARAHISSTLDYLLKLSTDLDELRNGVSHSTLVGETTLIEVHLDTIRMGVQRLEDGRKRAIARSQETLVLMQAEVGAQLLPGA